MHTPAETSPSKGPCGAARLSTPALGALALSLVAAFGIILAVALPAYHKGSSVGLFFQGCDPFCYSQMADAMRDARSSGRSVDYFLKDDQTQFLITKFKEAGLPWTEWWWVVAPHGYFYSTLTDAVGPQYPPGTPWLLSLFPRHGAVHALNRISIILTTLAGLAFIVWCALRRLPLSCLVIALVTYAFLDVFTWIDLASFSINATIFPLFGGIILAWFARERTQGMTALLLALAGGVGIGIAVENRIASVLLIATMILFFLPGRFGLIAAHLAGILLGGIAPVLTHNKLVAGGYFYSTYGGGDLQQSLACIWTNFLFYCHWWFQTSIIHVAMLACALAAFAAWVRFTTRAPAIHWHRWKWDHAGLILAAPSAILLATAFFLTHVVSEGYYFTPSMLTGALTTALLFVSLEIEWRTIDPAAARRRRFSWATAALAVAGGATAIGLSALDDLPDGMWDTPYPASEPVVQFDLPREMQDPHAWIWCHMFSGSVRYYTGHPAFRSFACSPQTRKMLYGWIKARGERQYLIGDCDTMLGLIDEARATGWKTTLIGHVRDAPCYRMDASP